MLFKHHCAPSAVVAAPFDPASAIVVVTGTPGVIPLRDGEVPRTHGFTAMQATQLLGIDGAEYFRRAAAGLVGKANV